jgi:glyoxylase-like metal-dependent hydrolase (beta-lactamase superfamily II)
MLEVAQGVWQLPLAPRQSVNAYLVGDVLVDAGTAGMGKKLPGRLAGRPVAAHAITHAHPDHVGGSKAVVDALGVPFWCPSGDAAAVEAGMSVPGESKLKPVLSRGSGFPSVPIARQLDEGDEVAGFTVLHTPGHSAGHIALWRERDRVLIVGDVFFNLHLATLRPGLRQPPGPFTVDPAQNRASERRLAALAPSTVCFGHGPVLRDAAPKLEAFVAALPG